MQTQVGGAAHEPPCQPIVKQKQDLVWTLQ